MRVKKVSTTEKKLIIRKCSDLRFWYSKLVNEAFTIVNEFEDCYIVRPGGGYSNMVLKADCELVQDE